ncbi:MAG: hypothetical protein ACRDRP_00500 [Pseudonocardiaceae bacterium]
MADELHIGEVDDGELRIILASVLPRGAQFRHDEVEYRTMADEWALSLQYQRGQVVDAVAGPAMIPELSLKIIAAIKQALLAPRVSSVWRWTLFSSKPVEGHWRYRDEFQIGSAPPNAPRPNELMAQYPFILDFRFNDSPDFEIRQLRWLRRASNYTLILNLLLGPRIDSPSARVRKHWVWTETGGSPPVRWAQEGYIIPGLRHLVEDLPSPEFAPLNEVPAEQYYNYRVHYSDHLTVPAELTRLIDGINGMNHDDQERLLRACFWYSTASKVWDHSQSLHLTSLVNAVECLASIGPERSKPEGPSKLFVSFMKKFAPGNPSGRQLNKIYGTRGKITHGERLLHLDQSSPTGGLDQISARDREVGDNASFLCRGALINWVWSHTYKTDEHLIREGLPRTPPTCPGTKSGVTIVIPS